MKKKIVLVDDDPDILFTLKDDIEELYQHEYEVFTASSSEECLDLLSEIGVPDLIFLDIMMPDRTGLQFHDVLKKKDSLFKEVPIIFLSGTTNEDMKEVGGWFGESYIEKPYEIEDLREKINKILKK